MTLALCFMLLARLYGENLSVSESQCQNSSAELGDVEVSVTPPFHVYVQILLAPPSVLGAWSSLSAMATVESIRVLVDALCRDGTCGLL